MDFPLKIQTLMQIKNTPLPFLTLIPKPHYSSKKLIKLHHKILFPQKSFSPYTQKPHLEKKDFPSQERFTDTLLDVVHHLMII